MGGTLFAVSDLHVSFQENRPIVDGLRPNSDADWLLVAGDVGELFGDIVETLTQLRRRFTTVIWAPGNHELWTHPSDPVELRGEARYQALVQACRDNGVLTPEDEFPMWRGEGGPATVVPLFLLYDYSFRSPGTSTKEESLRSAYDAGIVCTDEMLLHPDPFPNRESWCHARLKSTEERLDELDPDVPTVLVAHWPLRREPTEVMRFPEFAQWCGTELTADWHTRYRAAAVIYGHLHIPRTTYHDGTRFEEVSLGYPREWRRRAGDPRPMRPVFGGVR
jgi:3',5'-cyclic AMP phosphodiesterase CpdA